MLLASLAVLVGAAIALPSAATAQDPPSPTADPAPQAQGSFVVEWDKLKKPHRAIGRKLRKSKAIERVAAAVNELVAIPRDIAIGFTDETTVGPAYIPDQRGQELHFIVFPGTFLRLEHDALRAQLRGVKDLGVHRALRYANQFIIAHEIGHALVDQLKLPITGKEEDAVDGFAAYLLTKDERFGPMGPISAAILFDAIKTDDGKLGDSDFADEHSLPQQRVYQFLCWVYGSDTKRYKDLVGKDLLPRDRARRCKAEYRQLSSSWDRLLEPHRKDAAVEAQPAG